MTGDSYDRCDGRQAGAFATTTSSMVTWLVSRLSIKVGLLGSYHVGAHRVLHNWLVSFFWVRHGDQTFHPSCLAIGGNGLKFVIEGVK